MINIKSVLLDTSFCIRLLKKDDEFHQSAMDYFEYFLNHSIEMYLSTIVVSEYAVGDNPDNLLMLQCFRLLEFDYNDAKLAGEFFKYLKDKKNVRKSEQRKVVINDIKLFAQIHQRKIDAYITKDRKSIQQIINPLKDSHFNVNFQFIDLTIPLNEKLGKLF